MAKLKCVVVLAVMLGGALAGCTPQQRSGQGAAGVRPIGGEGARPQPAAGDRGAAGTVLPAGELVGEYRLARATLKQPWWRDVVGSLVRKGEGAYEGSLYRFGKPTSARLQVTGSGTGTKGKLTLDLNQDGKLEEKALDSVSAESGQGGVTRLLFPPVKSPQSWTFTPGVQFSAGGRQEGAVVYAVATDYLEAQWPKGKPHTVKETQPGHHREGQVDISLRLIPGLRTTGGETTVWVDSNRDGAVAAGEAVTTSAALVGGRLYRLTVSGPGPDKVTLAPYDQPTGVLTFEATDSKGAPSTANNVTLLTPAGQVAAPGSVASMEAPVGELQVVYKLPVSEEVVAQVNVPQPVRVSPGETTTLQVGGPVRIALDVSSQSGNVIASAKLTTATGHDVRAFEGPGEHSGIVEVLDRTGKVLASGKLEFG